MAAELHEQVETAPLDDAEIGGLAGWARRALPTGFVLALLVGLASWGHFTEWEFGWHRNVDHGAEESSIDQGIRLIVGQTVDAKSDIPLPLRRQLSLTFPSAKVVERLGIEVMPVWSSPMTDTLPASGELSFDPGRVARLSARVRGSVWKAVKKLGDSVAASELVAILDSADIGKVKAELETALVQVRLQQKTVASLKQAGTAVPDRQHREAAAALRDAEVRLSSNVQTLVNFGFTIKPGELDGLPLNQVSQQLRGLGMPNSVGYDLNAGSANLLPVKSPFAGVILQADVVTGEVVEAGQLLFVVADPRRLWLTLHVPQEQARRIAVGQAVKFRPDGAMTEIATRIAWIGTTADEMTRNVPVRAEVANDKGELRASTLGQGRIVLREIANALVVPRDAVQSYRGSSVVFVRHPDFLKGNGQKEFMVRAVRVGASDATNVEITSGLRPEEIVAGKGANVLLAELNRLAQTAIPAR